MVPHRVISNEMLQSWMGQKGFGRNDDTIGGITGRSRFVHQPKLTKQQRPTHTLQTVRRDNDISGMRLSSSKRHAGSVEVDFLNMRIRFQCNRRQRQSSFEKSIEQLRAMDDILRRSVNLFDLRHRWGYSKHLSVLPPLHDNITETDSVSIKNRSQSPFIDYSGQIWRHLDPGADLHHIN